MSEIERDWEDELNNREAIRAELRGLRSLVEELEGVKGTLLSENRILRGALDRILAQDYLSDPDSEGVGDCVRIAADAVDRVRLTTAEASRVAALEAVAEAAKAYRNWHEGVYEGDKSGHDLWWDFDAALARVEGVGEK